MKRIAFVAPFLTLALAACASGSRHPAHVEYASPPLPPPRPHPSAPPPVSHPSAPTHVASAGPLKLAGVSAYMDNEEKDLRTRMRPYAAIVARRGDDLVVNVTNAVLFDGSVELSNNGASALIALSTILRRYDHTAVTVSGFTDTTGDPDQNMTVSQKRARLIADTLAKDGVAGPRLNSQGFGETNLKIRTGDSVSEPRNRRIEIRISATPAA